MQAQCLVAGARQTPTNGAIASPSVVPHPSRGAAPTPGQPGGPARVSREVQTH